MGRKRKQSEDSVNVALRTLLTLEDERQYEETELNRLAELEKQRLKKEEARQKDEAEALDRQHAEEALLKAEKEERERKDQLEREEALRLAIAKIEARTKAEVEFEDRQRSDDIQATPRSISRRAVVVSTTLILVNALVVASLYFYSQNQNTRFKEAHKSTMQQWRQTYEAQLTDANRRVYDARLEAISAKEKSDKLEDRLESALAPKPIATKTDKKRPIRNRPKPRPIRNRHPKVNKPADLTGDPLQEFKVDN